MGEAERVCFERAGDWEILMKRIFGIHGWEGSPNYGWWPWFKKSLEEKGFEVSVPQMPNAAHPKMDEWLEHLKKIVGKPDENCF